MLSTKSSTYRDQLQQMCRVLCRSNVVQQKARGLINGTERLKQSMAVFQTTRTDYRLVLDPNWRVDLEKDPMNCGVSGQTELHFGGEITFKNRCLERQVLTVLILFRAEEDADPCLGRPCIIAGQNYVVRRFHFDFDQSITNTDRPIAHLQIGGSLNEKYLDLANSDSIRYELFDKLTSPRLPWSITDLPIVLDVFLRQFSTGLDSFLLGPEWRKLVMKSEHLWLMDFFRKAAEMMSKSTNQVSLYDFCCDLSAFD